MGDVAWFPHDLIHEFWYAESLDKPETLDDQARLWFASNDLIDFEIKRRFARLFEPLLALEPASLAGPRQVLAAVLTLDQFSRKCFRSTPKAFAYDAKALEFLDYAIDRNLHDSLEPLEKAFLYMPLQNAENISRQKAGGKKFRELAESAAEPYKTWLQGMAKYARQQRVIIERFGRFPHRNRILGRKPMSEELEYLTSDGNNFVRQVWTER